MDMQNEQLPVLPHRWLTLAEAAQFLGIHPSTLRRWADDGQICCMRTPGGHRRFLEQDLHTFLEAHEQPTTPSTSDSFLQIILQQTRREMSLEQVEAQSWHAAFDERSRAARRESGQRLLGLALQYTLRSTGRETILEEAQRIGREYGEDAVRRGLSLTDTVRALFFFRETLIRSARPGLITRGQYDAEDVHIHRSLREFLDEVLFAALEGYESSWRPALPGGCPA